MCGNLGPHFPQLSDGNRQDVIQGLYASACVTPPPTTQDTPVRGQGPRKGSAGPGADPSGGPQKNPGARMAAARRPQCEWSHMRAGPWLAVTTLRQGVEKMARRPLRLNEALGMMSRLETKETSDSTPFLEEMESPRAPWKTAGKER